MDGLDEMTIAGPSRVSEGGGGHVSTSSLDAEAFGLSEGLPAALVGGDAEANAAITLAILSGERGARRDVVLMNAALALVASARAETLVDGAAMAAEAIDSGAARRKLEQLRNQTQR